MGADGSILKHKARLVAKGFQQDLGINVGETFNPVAKLTTVRVILITVVTLNWPIGQVDIDNAFLNGSLKESVFMKQPQYFEDPKYPRHVCRLKKALYGLKQDPRAWYDRLRNTLLEWGFQHTKK